LQSSLRSLSDWVTVGSPLLTSRNMIHTITGIGTGYETAQLLLRIEGASPTRHHLTSVHVNLNKHVSFAVDTSIYRARRCAAMLMPHPDPSVVPSHSFRLSAHREIEVQQAFLPPG